jgi:hypothetical protein
MANALQLRRGTTTEHGSFTGLAGEITVDTTKDTLVIHDGSTAGGIPLAKESAISTNAATLGGQSLSQIQTAYEGYADTAAANVVDSAPATLDTLNELAAALGDDANFSTTVTNSIATKMPLAGGTFTGNVTFGDNDKAIFGAGSDLQIYHDGTHSYVQDNGTGNLRIKGSNINLESNSGHDIFQGIEGGSASIYYNNAVKLATSSTGVNITGTAVTDGVTVDGPLDIEEVKEKVASSTSTTGTSNFDLANHAIVNFTANQTANRTINFRADSSTTLNSIMNVDQSMTCTLIMKQGSTAYYLNAYQVDGSTVTPKWSGGSAPTGGNADSLDVYTFTIIKTADATFTVLASQSQYA